MKNSIILDSFCYDYLFENLNLIIPKNSFITISGPNNCGKTTLLRVLNRELITSNKILVEDRNINEYRIEEYSKLVQTVIPLEIVFKEETVLEELSLINPLKKDINRVLGELKIKDHINKRIDELSSKDIVLIQLAISLLRKPSILLIDDLNSYLDRKTIKEVLKVLNKYKDKITIIYATINLEDTIDTDHLYIISDRKVALEGEPLEVLQRDNIINKIGLKLPFMVDLSVKLKDYELINSIELEPIRMVNKLWK